MGGEARLQLMLPMWCCAAGQLGSEWRMHCGVAREGPAAVCNLPSCCSLAAVSSYHHHTPAVSQPLFLTCSYTYHTQHNIHNTTYTTQHTRTCPPPPAPLQSSSLGGLYLRHDQYHTYGSLLEDGADALDAAFRMRPGCGGPASTCATASRAATSTTSFDQLRSSSDDSIKARVLAETDDDPAVSFEAVNSPGMYLTVDPQGLLVLQREQHGLEGCRHRMFKVRQGLDGKAGSYSLESASLPGHYVSLAKASDAFHCQVGCRGGRCRGCTDGWLLAGMWWLRQAGRYWCAAGGEVLCCWAAGLLGLTSPGAAAVPVWHVAVRLQPCWRLHRYHMRANVLLATLHTTGMLPVQPYITQRAP
jgi:hypothetical protein